MSKQETIISFIIKDLVGFIMEDYSLSMDAAMKLLYESTFFKHLTDPGTGLYLEGSAYVYELLKDEIL